VISRAERRTGAYGSRMGDEVQDEDAAEFLDHLVHQVVQAAARGLDLERESAGAEPGRYLPDSLAGSSQIAG
jgi:hypothetical protein